MGGLLVFLVLVQQISAFSYSKANTSQNALEPFSLSEIGTGVVGPEPCECARRSKLVKTNCFVKPKGAKGKENLFTCQYPAPGQGQRLRSQSILKVKCEKFGQTEEEIVAKCGKRSTVKNTVYKQPIKKTFKVNASPGTEPDWFIPAKKQGQPLKRALFLFDASFVNDGGWAKYLYIMMRSKRFIMLPLANADATFELKDHSMVFKKNLKKFGHWFKEYQKVDQKKTNLITNIWNNKVTILCHGSPGGQATISQKADGYTGSTTFGGMTFGKKMKAFLTTYGFIAKVTGIRFLTCHAGRKPLKGGDKPSFLQKFVDNIGGQDGVKKDTKCSAFTGRTKVKAAMGSEVMVFVQFLQGPDPQTTCGKENTLFDDDKDKETKCAKAPAVLKSEIDKKDLLSISDIKNACGEGNNPASKFGKSWIRFAGNMVTISTHEEIKKSDGTCEPAEAVVTLQVPAAVAVVASPEPDDVGEYNTVDDESAREITMAAAEALIVTVKADFVGEAKETEIVTEEQAIKKAVQEILFNTELEVDAKEAVYNLLAVNEKIKDIGAPITLTQVDLDKMAQDSDKDADISEPPPSSATGLFYF